MNLNVVRLLAGEEEYEEIFCNEKSKVISFRPRPYSSQLQNDDDKSIRINVYWTTGTVGTCLNHPRQGKTQLFRRNVDIAQLRLIFKNPRLHTGSGYHRCAKTSLSSVDEPFSQPTFYIGERVYVNGYTYGTVKSGIIRSGQFAGRIKIEYDDGQEYHVIPNQLKRLQDVEETSDEESEVKTQLDWLTNEISFLQKQKEQVESILESFEEKRRQKAAAEAAERERKEKLLIEQKLMEAVKKEMEKQKKLEEEQEQKRLRKIALQESRGKYLDYFITQSDHISKCFNETVVSMSCGGNTTIMLYENGGWAWTSGLTKLLHNKLNGRQTTLPAPIYVAIGSQDRYYIKFKDGKSEWVGCDNMTEKLQNGSRTVRSVAFGEYWDSYFIVYDDGFWCCSNIPGGLNNLLNKRKKLADLNCVTLGPNGEYFLSANNGKAWWGGTTVENMNNIRKYQNRIKFLDFDNDYGYLLRYS